MLHSFTKTKGLGLKGLGDGSFIKLEKRPSSIYYYCYYLPSCSLVSRFLSRNVASKERTHHKAATFLRGTNDETKVTAAVSERYYQQHLQSFIRKKCSTRHLAKMMGACVGEEELEGKKRVKKQRRKFSALPQKRLNIRSEAEAVEILGLNGDDYKFVCKEGTKDQVSSSFLFEKSL